MCSISTKFTSKRRRLSESATATNSTSPDLNHVSASSNSLFSPSISTQPIQYESRQHSISLNVNCKQIQMVQEVYKQLEKKDPNHFQLPALKKVEAIFRAGPIKQLKSDEDLLNPKYFKNPENLKEEDRLTRADINILRNSLILPNIPILRKEIFDRRIPRMLNKMYNATKELIKINEREVQERESYEELVSLGPNHRSSEVERRMKDFTNSYNKMIFKIENGANVNEVITGKAEQYSGYIAFQLIYFLFGLSNNKKNGIQVQLLKTLKKAGAELNLQEEKTGKTLLMLACGFKCLASVKFLITAGVNIDLRDNFGENALSYTLHHTLLPNFRH